MVLVMTNKISHKIIFGVALVSITVIGIFSLQTSRSVRTALMTQIDDTANQLSETIKSSTKYDMLLNQRKHIHRIIDTISRQEGIEKIRIFNKEGVVNYSSDKTEIGKMVDKKAESCYACHAANQPIEKLPINERTRTFVNEADHENFGIINPIYNEPGCWQADCHAHAEARKVLGVLDVTLSLEEVEAQIQTTQNNLIILACSAVVAISFIIWLLMKNLVGKPVGNLVLATNKIAGGDLNYKIKLKQNDELGQLGKSFNDMTEKLTKAQQQLYQSEKLASLGRLAAGVAHEINNPLTGVLTYASFLQKRIQEPETKSDLDVIVRETKRCREIVKGLLDFARQAPPQKSNINLNDVIHHSLHILDNQLCLKNINVKTGLAKLPNINVDSNQIQQVIINLLVNASDAIGNGGGEIKVETKTERNDTGESLVMSVSDTGCGMSKEQQSKIFEPFFTTKGQKGTGLGLAVVWGIIDKHHGKMDVKSEPGKGTRFTVTLPVNENASLIVEK